MHERKQNKTHESKFISQFIFERKEICFVSPQSFFTTFLQMYIHNISIMRELIIIFSARFLLNNLRHKSFPRSRSREKGFWCSQKMKTRVTVSMTKQNGSMIQKPEFGFFFKISRIGG